MKNKTRQVVLHVLGCLIFLMLPLPFAPDWPESFNVFQSAPTLRTVIAYLLMIGFFYANFFVLIPRFFFPKKYALYFLFVVAWFMTVVILPPLVVPQGSLRPAQPAAQFRMHENEPPLQAAPDGRPKPPPPSAGNGFHKGGPPVEPGHLSVMAIAQNLFIFLSVFFFSLMLRISNRWRKTEEEKLHAELSYLKLQMNPHFLFNTLNNIYSLALEKSDKTAAAVVKLSGMMRYVISETEHDFVPLGKEIGYIRSYIELQQIRYGDSIRLSVDISGDTAGKKIAPLLLIPFIENAFKYGVNAEEDSVIDVQIAVENDELHLLVVNNKVYTEYSGEMKTGLGIGNTRSRLQLLYPSKHILVMNDNDKQFSVSLKLLLK